MNNQLNLLGRNAIHKLHLDVTALMDINVLNSPSTVNAVFDNLTTDETLQAACTKLCEEFPDVFKQCCLQIFQTATFCGALILCRTLVLIT